MRTGWSSQADLAQGNTQIDPVPGENLLVIAPVNHRQRIDAKNAGNHALGFEVREPAYLNCILFVTALARDSLAACFDISHRETQLLTCGAKLISYYCHDSPSESSAMIGNFCALGKWNLGN